jgi:hypothetical protein
MIIRLDRSNRGEHEVGWTVIPKHSSIYITCFVEIAELRQLFKD